MDSWGRRMASASGGGQPDASSSCLPAKMATEILEEATVGNLSTLLVGRWRLLSFSRGWNVFSTSVDAWDGPQTYSAPCGRVLLPVSEWDPHSRGGGGLSCFLCSLFSHMQSELQQGAEALQVFQEEVQSSRGQGLGLWFYGLCNVVMSDCFFLEGEAALSCPVHHAWYLCPGNLLAEGPSVVQHPSLSHTHKPLLAVLW